uniref:Uncharacterized protein n=1 Tax=Amphimedon queenslandica TaxID=400682 RepID=A0A1X7TT96_AMPQE
MKSFRYITVHFRGKEMNESDNPNDSTVITHSDAATEDYTNDLAEDIRRSNAMFIFKMFEVRKLTITAANNILSNVELLIKDIVMDVQRRT